MAADGLAHMDFGESLNTPLVGSNNTQHPGTSTPSKVDTAEHNNNSMNSTQQQQQQQHMLKQQPPLSVSELRELLDSIETNIITLSGGGRRRGSVAADANGNNGDDDDSSRGSDIAVEIDTVKGRSTSSRKIHNLDRSVLDNDPLCNISLQDCEFLVAELLGIAIPYCDHNTKRNNSQIQQGINQQQSAYGSPSKSVTFKVSKSTLPATSTTDATIQQLQLQQQPQEPHYALVTAQMEVEVALWHCNHHFHVEEQVTKRNRAPGAALAESQTLKDIQRELHSELWDHAPASSISGGEIIGGRGRTRDSGEVPIFHVVDDVNNIMHNQRVDQANQYLELLNVKAARKKKALKSLFNLWQAAKISIAEGNKMKAFSDDVESKRLLAMPMEEIIQQAYAIQATLTNDMQKDVGTKTKQLEDRINLLREGLLRSTIPDHDGALVSTLTEISALEESLLQANSDAMRLASRIVNQVEAKWKRDARRH